MKKDTLIVLCSPDIRRRNARLAINSIKNTNIERAELMVIDNCHDPHFSHPVVMNKMLKYAADRNLNLIYLDDDVEIYHYHWIDRLHQAANDLGADIVSGVQIDESGEINSLGEFIYSEGNTVPILDFIHRPDWIVNRATYVPVLCSAIMLVKNCDRYYIDRKYRKYKQDLDVCMQAWVQGQKVGIALDLKLIHNRGFTAENNPNFRSVLTDDAVYFGRKWQDQISKMLELPELEQYKSCDCFNTWKNYYNTASRIKNLQPEQAVKMFLKITKDCIDDYYISGAFYHLYHLTDEIEYLKSCNALNPCHKAARALLEEKGQQVNRYCHHHLNCDVCRFKPPIPASRSTNIRTAA